MHIPIYLFTYNLNKRIQDRDIFIAKVVESFPEEPATIFAFGFEELCSTLDGAFTNIANERLIELNDLVIDCLNYKYGPDLSFQTLALSHIGAIGLTVITPFPSRFSNVKVASATCGYFFSSLKGAAGVRVTYRGKNREVTQLTFANSHLTAYEGDKYWKIRNKNVTDLMRSLDFIDGYGLIKPDTHCFFMGDLNFRTKRDSALNYSENEHIQFMHDIDELSISRDNGDIFVGFNEAEIKFSPTYKYIVGSEFYDSKRIPSWCDRILYQGTYPDPPRILNYNSIEGIVSSDHQPVFLNIIVPFIAPSSIIDTRGYLIDDLHRVEKIYLLPNFRDKVISKVSLISDAGLGYTLFIVGRPKGRIYAILVLVGLYLIYAYI